MTQHAVLPESSLAARLRAATHPTHEVLDRTIMAADPFAGLEPYGRYLRMQHALHRDVAPLYARDDLAARVPDLARRCRLQAAAQDAADLGVALSSDEPAAAEGLPEAEALGWLYVVEGSNLGAAFLLKAAKKMGLSETHGAHHLAEAPEGRAPQWRAFKDALDQASAEGIDEAAVIRGAEAAFGHVTLLAHRHLA